jgi:uncharacterized repeat protein (TIGR04076 family)
MDLIIQVKEIKGECPVYQVGDEFSLKDGYRLVADKPLCMHSLTALIPHYNALRVAAPAQFGIADQDDPTRACVQCLDPGPPHTEGGTVIFQIRKG